MATQTGQGLATKVRIHRILRDSRANGPGRRHVIWFQGCTLGCRDCFNPYTHSASAGDMMTVRDLLVDLHTHRHGIAGLTVSGGEPFQQPEALRLLLGAVKRETDLSVIVFSGYRLEEIQRNHMAAHTLADIDVLVAGRYVPGWHFGENMLGSSNQVQHFLSDRYGPDDLAAVPPAEVQIAPDGQVIMTGVAPPDLSLSAEVS